MLDPFHIIQASCGINSHLFPACHYLLLSQHSFSTKLLFCWLFLSNTAFSNLGSSVSQQFREKNTWKTVSHSYLNHCGVIFMNSLEAKLAERY